MLLLDRYILFRFLTNFMLLYVLLFVFAVSIDMVMALDRFVDALAHLAPKAIGVRDGALVHFIVLRFVRPGTGRPFGWHWIDVRLGHP